MTQVDKQTIRDIKEWHRQNGVEFIESDWKDADYESFRYTGNIVLDTERESNSTPRAFTAGETHWWEDQETGIVWPPRTEAERETVEGLEEFFAPYIAMLSRPQGNVLLQYFGDRSTYRDMQPGGNWTSARERVQRALRKVVGLVAAEDPAYVAPTDGRARDYEGEVMSLRRQLDKFWNEKYGRAYPGLL